MAKEDYAEKWKDPRWQKKRLEIMERDGFACQICGDDSSTLAVHHISYDKGKDPWDYENDRLMTLCQLCHEHEHDTRREYEQLLLSVLRNDGFMADDVFVIAEGFNFIGEVKNKDVFSSALGWALKDVNFINAVTNKYLEFLTVKSGDVNASVSTQISAVED